MIYLVNEIKSKAKEKIENISSYIPNFFNLFINFIDDIIKLNFGPFYEYKIDISEHIIIFILEVESGNIKYSKEHLIKYLHEKLEIETTIISEIVEYLYKNRLQFLINKRINKIIIYRQTQRVIIKKYYYKPILNTVVHDVTYDPNVVKIEEFARENDIRNKKLTLIRI